jgi:hypothetical protein
MIEQATGKIQMPLGGICVSPFLTREQFLASPIVGQCHELVRNEPFWSFVLPATQFDGHSFSLSLWFRGSVLQRVSIMCIDAEFGSSWSDWSEERQMARKRFHDSFLQTVLGSDWSQRHFSWGKVLSCYDSNGGFSIFHIIYVA